MVWFRSGLKFWSISWVNWIFSCVRCRQWDFSFVFFFLFIRLCKKGNVIVSTLEHLFIDLSFDQKSFYCFWHTIIISIPFIYLFSFCLYRNSNRHRTLKPQAAHEQIHFTKNNISNDSINFKFDWLRNKYNEIAVTVAVAVLPFCSSPNIPILTIYRYFVRCQSLWI